MLPTITGTAQVGETLTADTTGISDDDGLDNAAFAYQWLADDAEIDGATASSYTLVADDAGKAIKVRVSFTDDAGNDEDLTSAATGAVAPAVVNPPLTASAQNVPSSHDGSATFIFELRFSADPKPDFSYATVRDHAFTVTGGAVTYVRRLDPPSNIRWEITVTPSSSADVAIALNATTDCSAQGAICTEEGGKLSGGLQLAVPGPNTPATDTPNTPATGLPTITGTAQVGDTLTAVTSGIEDDDGLGNAAFAYQWLADDAEIDNASPTADAATPLLPPSGQGHQSEGVLHRRRRQRRAAHQRRDGRRGRGSASSQHPGHRVAHHHRHRPGWGHAYCGYLRHRRRRRPRQRCLRLPVARRRRRDRQRHRQQLHPCCRRCGQGHQVRVSFTDDAGNDEQLTSAGTGAVAAAPPPPNTPATGLPTITGTAQVGETLTADTTGISDDDGLDNAAFAYQWLADDAEIDSATASSYLPLAADAGKAIKVRVSFTDDAGNGEQLTSAGTGAVAAAPPPPNTPATGLPTITGTAQVGETLTADTTGISDDDGLDNAAFAYQWLADDAEINGANASTYTLADDDEGKAIKVRVSFTDDAGNDEELTSAATSAVATAVVNPPLTASAQNVPSSHDGSATFIFELRFSEELVSDFSYVTMRDNVLTVTGGSVTYVRRLDPPSNIGWEIHVTPDSDGSLIIVLPVTEDCDAQGAICTEAGRPLSNRLELAVNGPGQ